MNMIYKRKVSREEIVSIKDRFNPRFVSTEYLEKILEEIETKPVRTTIAEEDISQENYNNGLTICSNCRTLYQPTYRRTVIMKITGQGKEINGPFCYGCANDIVNLELRQN